MPFQPAKRVQLTTRVTDASDKLDQVEQTLLGGARDPEVTAAERQACYESLLIAQQLKARLADLLTKV